jgi:hypothetical protein
MTEFGDDVAYADYCKIVIFYVDILDKLFTGPAHRQWGVTLFPDVELYNFIERRWEEMHHEA